MSLTPRGELEQLHKRKAAAMKLLAEMKKNIADTLEERKFLGLRGQDWKNLAKWEKTRDEAERDLTALQNEIEHWESVDRRKGADEDEEDERLRKGIRNKYRLN